MSPSLHVGTPIHHTQSWYLQLSHSNAHLALLIHFTGGVPLTSTPSILSSHTIYKFILLHSHHVSKSSKCTSVLYPFDHCSIHSAVTPISNLIFMFLILFSIPSDIPHRPLFKLDSTALFLIAVLYFMSMCLMHMTELTWYYESLSLLYTSMFTLLPLITPMHLLSVCLSLIFLSPHLPYFHG